VEKSGLRDRLLQQLEDKRKKLKEDKEVLTMENGK
jgi:hypothetical protein